MLAADEELANKVAEYAKRRNVTVYQTVNEILSQALKAETQGYNLKDLVDNRQSLDNASSIGLGLTIDNVFSDILEMSQRLCPNEVEEVWKRAGHWYGKYFHNKMGDAIDYIASVVKYMAMGKAEVSVSRPRENELNLIIVNCSMSPSHLDGLMILLIEMTTTMDLQAQEQKKQNGVITLRLKQ